MAETPVDPWQLFAEEMAYEGALPLLVEPLDALPELIQQLEEKMKNSAKNLDFEEAANLRDRIKGLRQKLVGKA